MTTRQSFPRSARPASLSLGLGIALLSTTAGHAAIKTWDGGGADANWLTTANWDADTAPASGDSLIFDGSTRTGAVNNFTYTANTTPNFAGLTFAATAGAFTLSGNTFVLGGNLTQASAFAQTVQNDIFVNGNRTIDIAAGELTLGRVYSATTGRNLIKTGAGTLKLTRFNGASTGGSDFTGYTINAGTLILASSYGHTAADGVTINNGGTLKYDKDFITVPANAWQGQVNGTIAVNRGGVWDLNGTGGGDESFFYANNRFQTLTGQATDGTLPAGRITNTAVGDPASISVRRRSSGIQTYAGIIEGDIGIDFAYGGAGSGQINVLSGANTYTGHTEVHDEALVINGDQSAATGNLLVRAVASARLAGTGTIGAASVVIGGQFSPGNLTSAAAAGETVGTLHFTGAVTFTPTTNTWLGAANTAANGITKLNLNLNKWSGAVAGTDHDRFIARSIHLATTTTNKLNIAVLPGAGLGFDDSAQSFTLATTTEGVTGITADNWQVTGVVAAGTWSLSAGNGGLDLVLTYTPAAPTASKVWDGGGANDNLTTAANWVGDVAPVAPESIGFAGAVRPNPVVDLNANSSFAATADTTEAIADIIVLDSTGIVVGQGVTGDGILADTRVTAVNGTTITLSNAPVATATGVSLTFTTFAYVQADGIVFYPGAASFTLSGQGINIGDTDETPVRIVNDGAALQTIAAPLTLRSNSNQIWTRAGDLSLLGSVSSPNIARTVTHVGAGTTTLGGTTDNAFLVVAPAEGTVVLAKDSAAGVHAAYRLAMGGTVTGTVRLAGTGNDQLSDTQDLAIDAGVLDLNGRSEKIQRLSGIANLNETQGNIVNTAATASTLTVTQTTNTGFGGRLQDGAGTISLVVTGTNELQLTAANTYSGGTTILGGSVRAGLAASLGTGPITLADSQNVTEALPLSLRANSWPENAGRTLYIANTAMTLANNLVAAEGTNNVVEFSFNGNLTYAGTLSGAGTVRLLNGFAPRHIFQGSTAAFAGTLQISSHNGVNTLAVRETSGGFPAAKVALIPYETGAAVLEWLPNVAADGVVALGELASDSTNYVTTAAIPATVRNGAANTIATWKIGALGTSSTYQGVIINGAGASAVEKVGAGTLTLSGVNAYTGDTTVGAGTLALGQAVLADASVVRVATGATLDLAHGATDTVGAFVIDGVVQPAGVWGPLGSGAAHETARLTGSGRLQSTYGALDAPVLSATAGDTTVGLSWTASTGATSYTLKRATVSGGPYAVVSANVTATNYTDNTVLNGTTYHYVVSANQVLLSSNQVSATPAAAPASAFAAWAAAQGLTAGVNDGPQQDPDSDGIANILEFVLGGDALASATGILPTQAIVGSDLVVSFKRSDASEAEVSGLIVQYGTNLSTWTDVAVGATTSGPDVAGVVVTIAENGAEADDVSVAIPMSLASGGRLFARVRAVYTLP